MTTQSHVLLNLESMRQEHRFNVWHRALSHPMIPSLYRHSRSCRVLVLTHYVQVLQVMLVVRMRAAF